MQEITSTKKEVIKVRNSISIPLTIFISLLFLLGITTIQSVLAIKEECENSPYGYDNCAIPRIDSVQPTTTTSISNANVTSVTSGDGCIFVNPTTGNVIITFNTSCGNTGVTSVTSGDNYLIFNPTTGNVIGSLNGTVINTTIDQRIASNPSGFINSSVANSTYYLLSNQFNYINVTSGQVFNDTNLINTKGNFFFANFTTSFNNNLTASLPLTNRTISNIANITGFFFNYNGTTAVFTQALLNNTIAQYGLLIGFNSTLNSTYATFAYNQTGNFGYNQTRVNSINSLEAWTIVNQSTDNVYIGLNSTVLNSTIQSNVFGSTILNNTYVKKAGDTMTGELDVDMTTLGAWLAFEFFSTQVGRITSENAVFQIMGNPGFFDTWLGDCGAACAKAGILGYFEFTTTKGTRMLLNSITQAEFNTTAVTMITNNTIIRNTNGSTIIQINDTKTTLYSNFSVIGNITASIDTCNGAGYCLNKSAQVATLPFKNFTILWWDNTTQRYYQVNDTPTSGDAPTYCPGVGGGWTFINKDSGACPL